MSKNGNLWNILAVIADWTFPKCREPLCNLHVFLKEVLQVQRFYTKWIWWTWKTYDFNLTCENFFRDQITLFPIRFGHNCYPAQSSWGHTSEGMGGNPAVQSNILSQHPLFSKQHPEVFCLAKTRLPWHIQVSRRRRHLQPSNSRRSWQENYMRGKMDVKCKI